MRGIQSKLSIKHVPTCVSVPGVCDVVPLLQETVSWRGLDYLNKKVKPISKLLTVVPDEGNHCGLQYHPRKVLSRRSTGMSLPGQKGQAHPGVSSSPFSGLLTLYVLSTRHAAFTGHLSLDNGVYHCTASQHSAHSITVEVSLVFYLSS